MSSFQETFVSCLFFNTKDNFLCLQKFHFIKSLNLQLPVFQKTILQSEVVLYWISSFLELFKAFFIQL